MLERESPSQEENAAWKAPVAERNADKAVVVVSERTYREETDEKIAQALQKIAESPNVSKAEIDSRLKSVTDEIIRAEDDGLRRTLVIERAALLAYKKDREGSWEADGVVTVDEADDMPFLPRALDEKYPIFNKPVSRRKAERTYHHGNDAETIPNAELQKRKNNQEAA